MHCPTCKTPMIYELTGDKARWICVHCNRWYEAEILTTDELLKHLALQGAYA